MRRVSKFITATITRCWNQQSFDFVEGMDCSYCARPRFNGVKVFLCRRLLADSNVKRQSKYPRLEPLKLEYFCPSEQVIQFDYSLTFLRCAQNTSTACQNWVFLLKLWTASKTIRSLRVKSHGLSTRSSTISFLNETTTKFFFKHSPRLYFDEGKSYWRLEHHRVLHERYISQRQFVRNPRRNLPVSPCPCIHTIIILTIIPPPHRLQQADFTLTWAR